MTSSAASSVPATGAGGRTARAPGRSSSPPFPSGTSSGCGRRARRRKTCGWSICAAADRPITPPTDYWALAIEASIADGVPFQVQVEWRPEDQYVSEPWRPWANCLRPSGSHRRPARLSGGVPPPARPERAPVGSAGLGFKQLLPVSPLVPPLRFPLLQERRYALVGVLFEQVVYHHPSVPRRRRRGGPARSAGRTRACLWRESGPAG